MQFLLDEYSLVTTNIKFEAAHKLLIHMANQTKYIDHKLTLIIDEHIAEDMQNYYNDVNQTLSTLKEKSKGGLLTMKVKCQTKLLKDHLEQLREIFEANQPPESVSDKQFFLKMKDSTSPIYDLLEEWEEQALSFVQERKVNVHPHQITSTRENMELLILHSYYVDARRKRYMELNHSCHYIFDQLLKDLQSK